MERCRRGKKERETIKHPENNDISKHKFNRMKKITNIWAKLNKTEAN